MHNVKIQTTTLLALTLLCFTLAFNALAEDDGLRIIAEVVFVSGPVQVERNAQTRDLMHGEEIRVGDRLATGSKGYLQIKFIDGGLISLRPESAALLQNYRYSPENPADNKVKISLEKGVMRSATGLAGKQNKVSFRINTPVAAIGIRGTDFVTYADNGVTKIDVYEGGIVGSPFNNQCLASALSPCSGESSAELFADIPNAMLEILRSNGYAEVVSGGRTPDEITPPHPNEVTLFETLISHAQQKIQQRVGLSSAGAESYEDGLNRAERYLGENSLVQQAFALGAAQPDTVFSSDRQLIDSDELIWGRWSTYAGQDPNYQRISDLLEEGRQYAVLNSVFTFLEKTDAQRILPSNGTVSFELNSYEAYIKRGYTLEVAGISNPALLVDFDDNRFATRMDIHAESLPGVVHVLGAGDLTETGFFHSDADSLTKIDGILTENALEAGLLFDYQVSPGVQAIGATQWVNSSNISPQP